tara:strand:+ start:484 stop:642 length:159 start_codon:yes stop_codon:yes gene_type:complete
MTDRYFKKPNGTIVASSNKHEILSFKDNYEECDVSGIAIKKVANKTKKKGDK